MPVTPVRTGPSFERNGVKVDPVGADRRCDDCGAPNAGFGETVRGITRCYCGWVNGAPVCVEPSQRYTVTVQKVGALSPADKLSKAEKRIAELEAQIAGRAA